jgi:hypothetical protein
MPNSLGSVPLETPIVDVQGRINQFFRRRWDELRTSFQQSPTVAGPGDNAWAADLSAALPVTAVYTTLAAGLYRITVYARKTIADGVTSSLQVTYGWSETGIPFTDVGAAQATDTTAAKILEQRTVQADANTDLTVAVAYASNTPGSMHYRLRVSVEQLTP